MKNIYEINKEIRENKTPLSKEEAKQYFVDMTNKLDIKHTFDFDEVYDIGLELRKRERFRELVAEAETQGRENNVFLSPEDTEKLNPVKESFADGCYIREIFNPAKELIITKIHKKQHPFFLLKGEMSILTEDGIKELKAPYHGITEVGTKRIIYTHTDCVFVTVHVTDKKSTKEIEEEVIAKDFNDPEVALDNIKEIKKKFNIK